MLRCRVGAALLVVAAATIGSRAQVLPMIPVATVAASSSGTLPVSPSVLAGYRFSPGDAGLSKLEALVLWRGQPSWQAKRTTSSGGSGSGAGSSGTSVSLWLSTANYGSFQLTASSDSSTSAFVVQGQTFDLRRTNVILVDAVDAPSGPVIVDTFRIEAQVPTATGAEILLPMFNAVPELRAFLRCGVAGPRTVPAMPDLCGKVAP